MANIFKSLDKIGLVVFTKRITLSIRKFFATKSEMDVVATALTDLDRRKIEASDVPTYSTATSDTLGLVKIGYTSNGKNYPVQLSNGQMYVNVPWTDTNDFRPITDIYLGTDSTTSLSQKGGNDLYYALLDGNADTVDEKHADDFIQRITVGKVTTGKPGTSVSVNASDTRPEVVLDFSIPRGADGKDGVTPTISIGSVTTVDAIKDAEVTNSGTYPDVVLDFKIPRGKQGPQGDMSEKDDNGYTNADVTKVDYCEIRKIWQIPFDTNVDFADKLKIPIPSLDMIQSMVDCIKMIHDVSLSINFNNFSTVKPLYTWSQLHWSLQCSNKNSGIVYVTKYGTNRNQSSFNIDKSGSITRSSTIIEIVVRYESNNTGNPYCVQVTVENEYGRAYYIGFTIGQEIVIK